MLLAPLFSGKFARTRKPTTELGLSSAISCGGSLTAKLPTGVHHVRDGGRADDSRSENSTNGLEYDFSKIVPVPQFTHIGGRNARVENLTLSICAVLVAEACNIGLEPLARPDISALTYARLAWVQQNYIRAETLIRANARLVNAQARIPLA